MLNTYLVWGSEGLFGPNLSSLVSSNIILLILWPLSTGITIKFVIIKEKGNEWNKLLDLKIVKNEK